MTSSIPAAVSRRTKSEETAVALPTTAPFQPVLNVSSGASMPSLVGRASVLDPSLFPLDTPVVADTRQIRSMEVLVMTDVSEVPLFKGSRFRCQRLPGGDEWTVTRYLFTPPSIQLPTIDNESSAFPFEIPSKDFQESLGLAKQLGIPIYALDRVPDRILGAGNIGQVYQTTHGSEKVAFKIPYRFVGVREGCEFYPQRLKPVDAKESRWLQYLSPVAEEAMLGSFFAAFEKAKGMKRLEPSRHYLGNRGIVYVRELNVWGPVFDFVEGTTLPEVYETPKQALEVMRDVALGLQSLDKQGASYLGIKTPNIMMTAPNRTVMIDDVGIPCSSESLQLLSRKQFGTFLFRSLHSFSPELPHLHQEEEPSEKWMDAQRALIQEKMGVEISSLLFACWSSNSLEEVSWERVIDDLKRAWDKLPGGSGAAL